MINRNNPVEKTLERICAPTKIAATIQPFQRGPSNATPSTGLLARLATATVDI